MIGCTIHLKEENNTGDDNKFDSLIPIWVVKD